MAEQARSFWIAAPRRGEIRTEPLAEPGADEVLVRTLYSGVSRGTESLVFAGAVPPSEHARMRAPVPEPASSRRPSNTATATSASSSSGPRRLVGRNVFCLYPHQTRYVVPARRRDAAAGRRAAGTRRARRESRDRGQRPLGRGAARRRSLAVVGAGTVGCLVAWLAARHRGLPRRARRYRRAQGRGRSGARRRRSERPPRRARDADVVVHTSGTAAGLRRRSSSRASRRRSSSSAGTARARRPCRSARHFTAAGSRSNRRRSVPSRPRSARAGRRGRRLALRTRAAARREARCTDQRREPTSTSCRAVLARLATAPGYTLCHRIGILSARRPRCSASASAITS